LSQSDGFHDFVLKYIAIILRRAKEKKRKKKEREREKRYLLTLFYLLRRRLVSRSEAESKQRCPLLYRDTSMSAINVGAAGSRTRLTREPSAKQMQRDQCQGCASSSSSRMLLRLLQVLQQISRAAARDERYANSSSQVDGT